MDRLSRQNAPNDLQKRPIPARPGRLHGSGIFVCASVAWTLAAWGGCANRGMQAPNFDISDGGFTVDMSDGSGGASAGGTSGPGQAGAGGATATGGASPGNGGTGGAGGGGLGGVAGLSGTGGLPGTGGTSGTGGTAGTGGAAGMMGTGGAGAGASTGTGGKAGAGGIAGAGGAAGSRAGTGGTGGGGGNAGAHGGAGGNAGAQGGAGGSMCSLGGNLDCSSSGALTLPGGKITDFSTTQWNNTTSQWCDASGLRGHLFAFAGAASSAAATVDTSAQNLKLNLTVGKTDYAGGGIMFESCVNASAFTSVQFTASITSGSLSGCVWQVQLQTQDQRPTTATDPTGGTCSSNCSAYPVVSNLAVPGATATSYTEAFTAFTNQTGSTIPLATQLVGVQWQVDSGNNGSGTCTVELRIDDVVFK
jgi:hypothetical protein